MTKLDFLKVFDNSRRVPHDPQKKTLTHISNNWDAHRVFAAQLPVATGKSAIAKAIQHVTGANIIVPSNLLMSQYVDTYKSTNFLRGKATYSCHAAAEASCADIHTMFEKPADRPCTNCTYSRCRSQALEGVPTVYNPLSLYYAAISPIYKDRTVAIIDEAHLLPQFINMISGKRFRRSDYNFPDNVTSELVIVPWLEAVLQRLHILRQQYSDAGIKFIKQYKEVSDEHELIQNTYLGLREDAQNYALWISEEIIKGKPETILNVQPLSPPRYLTDTIIGDGKVILMSGTLFKSDVQDIVGDEAYNFLDMPSPIAKERRRIYFRPIQSPVNRDTDPQLIVDWIERHVSDFPGWNTIVHVTYALAEKLKDLFCIPVITHTQETKEKALEQFKARGGVLIASGMSEGISLDDNLCTLNLIPQLPRPNLGDPVVEKKKALLGDSWYRQQTLKTTIQSAGRSTRHPGDFSVCIVGDPGFSRMFNQENKNLPQSFKEAVVLDSRPIKRSLS